MENSNSQIPINIRTVGNPQRNPSEKNIYVLYIEDYVHTFMQKNLEANNNVIKIALFGKCIDKNLVISGAVPSSGNIAKDKDTCAVNFTTCEYLGAATITRNDKNNIRFEIASGGMIVLIEDYYIYYDQNEEMQNYLISSQNVKSGRQSRNNDVARYGKILQAYNKEEAKVSFMWNMLNLLCMGLVVCFMANGIITINSYNKMQSMQSGIEYCMQLLDQQMVSAEAKIGDEAGSEPKNDIDTAIEAENNTEINTETTSEINLEIEAANIIATPQYYIVQKGDTLRSICYEVYGDYDYVEKVCLWNNIEDPNNILCGQKLLLQ